MSNVIGVDFKMPASPEVADSGIWTAFWIGIGGVFSTMGTGFLYLMGQISKNADQINKQGIADVTAALDVEKRFATKADIDRLEGRLMEQMRSLLREHETNVQRDIDMRVGRNHE